VKESQLAGLLDFENSGEFSELEKLVIRFGVAMTVTPVEISEDMIAALKQHFDDAQIVELTSSIAWENFRARFNHALGIEAEGFYKGALCLLPEHTPSHAGSRP
jgi:alkylhydroperoxidase family enzyme